MEEERFDRWAAGFGNRRSRRGFGGVAAGALAALGLTPAVVARKKRRKKKKPDGTCIEVAQECQGGGCCPGLECKPIFTVGSETFCCRSGGECRFGADCCRGTYCGGGECLPCKGVGVACQTGQCCPGSFCDSFSGTCESTD